MGFIDPEHVKSPEWGPFRRAVIEVQGNQCELCGEETSFPYIQPKNIYYTEGRLPWDYELDEMQVVCRSCFYGAIDRSKNVLDRLKEFSHDEQMQLLRAIKKIYDYGGRGSTGTARGFLEFIQGEITPLDLDEPDLDYTTRRAHAAMLALPPEALLVILQSLTLLRKVSASRRAQILSEL